ncbi:MAG: hypothetical protein QM676_04925 [Novosphingobium sp.]
MVRWSLVVAAGGALVACSQHEAAPPKVAEGAEKVECALGPGTSFAKDCAIERSREGGVYRMVVRHPDGGFRRFEVDQDNAIVSSDGADAAQVAVNGTVAEVTVGDDRYRIPLEAAPEPGALPASDAAKP